MTIKIPHWYDSRSDPREWSTEVTWGYCYDVVFSPKGGMSVLFGTNDNENSFVRNSRKIVESNEEGKNKMT